MDYSLCKAAVGRKEGTGGPGERKNQVCGNVRIMKLPFKNPQTGSLFLHGKRKIIYMERKKKKKKESKKRKKKMNAVT